MNQRFIIAMLLVLFALSDQQTTQNLPPVLKAGKEGLKQKLQSSEIRQEQADRQEEIGQDKYSSQQKTQDLTAYYCWKNPFTPSPAPAPTQKQALVNTRYGFQMYVDNVEISISLYIRTNGTWDSNMINLIGHFIKRGSNVLNLGSQTGLEALVMGRIVGPTGKLFVFQPFSGSFNLIKKSVQLNNLTQTTTLYNKAASDSTSKSTLTISSLNTGGASLVDRRKNPAIMLPGKVTRQEVQVDLVDNVLPDDVSLDFALIDVEMVQVQALKGMKKIIERSPKLVIIVEWSYLINPDKNRKQTQQLIDYLLSKGYSFYNYTGGDNIKCTVGKFIKKQNPKVELLRVRSENIIILPSTVQLPLENS